MEKRFQTVTDRRGNAVVNATLQVSTYPGGVLAVIYSDPAGIAQITNPLLTDSNGYCEYYAANGHYSWTITTNEGVRVINDILHNDPASANAGPFYLCTLDVSSTANALVLISSPSVGVLAAGQIFPFTANALNTGPVTAQIDGLIATAVTLNGNALTGAEIQPTKDYWLVNDGTHLNLFPVSTNGVTGAFVGVTLPGAVSGTTNAIILTPPFALPALQKYQRFAFVPAATNTNVVTIAIPGIAGTKNLFANGAALGAGGLPIGVLAEIMYDGVQFQLLNPHAAGSSSTNLPGLRICMISDSTAATNNNMPPGSTSILEQNLKALGQPCTVYSVAGDGLTYNRALNGFAGFQFGAKTAVQQCIAYAPDIVLVCLGPADLLVNVEARSLATVKADALALHAALRAGLPTATIVNVYSQWHDVANYVNPSVTLANQGVVPFFFTLNSAGILTNLWTSEILGTACSANIKTAYGNYVQLAAYTAGLNSAQGVDTTFNIRYWPLARMGMLLADMLHPNAGARQLLAGEFVNGFKGGYFAALFPTLMSNNEAPWDSVSSLFAQMFTASGSAWVENYDAISEAVRSSRLDMRPGTWWSPYPATVDFTPSSGAGATDDFIWEIKKGPPLAEVWVSIAGAAATDTGIRTDVNGEAFFTEAGQALLALGIGAGTKALRYQLLFATNPTVPVSVTIPNFGGGVTVNTPGISLPPANWTFGAATLVGIASGGTGAGTAAAALANLGGAAAVQGSGIALTALYGANWGDQGGNDPSGRPYLGGHYYKDTVNVVRVSGVLHRSGGGLAAGEVIFGAMPAGYRYAGVVGVTVMANGAAAGLTYDDQGNFRYQYGSGNGFGIDPVNYEGQ